MLTDLALIASLPTGRLLLAATSLLLVTTLVLAVALRELRHANRFLAALVARETSEIDRQMGLHP